MFPLRRQQRPRSGFTLIELIVAVVIIGVLSGVVIPRVMQRSTSAESRETERVAQLLSAMANRESLSSQQVQLTWDADASRLEVLTPSAEAADNTMRADRLIPGVTLELLSMTEATAGSQELRGEEWVFQTSPGLPRPLLTLLLEARSGRSWTIMLEPQGTVARVFAGDEPKEVLQSIDLDEEGMRDQAW